MFGADQNEAKVPNVNLMKKEEKEQSFHEINFQARKTKDTKTKENSLNMEVEEVFMHVAQNLVKIYKNSKMSYKISKF